MTNQYVFNEKNRGAYPFPGLRDNSLDEFVVVAFLVDNLVDDCLVFRVLLLLNVFRGSDVRVNASPDHLSAEGPPDARSIAGHAVLRLLQRIGGISPHLVHLKPQAVNGLLQQQVFCLLVVQATIRLLSQFKIRSELIDPIFEDLLFLVPFFRFDRVQRGRVGVLFDFCVLAAEAESVSFGFGTLLLVLLLKVLV